MDGVRQAIVVNEQYSKYVIYFPPNPIAGHGVIVGSYLITAAHVVSQLQKIFFEYEGERYIFTKNDALYFNENIHHGIEEDLAIFDLKKQISPLKIAEDLPSPNMSMTSISFVERGWSDDIFGNRSSKIEKTCKLGNAIFKEINQQGMLICRTNVHLKEGSSGSPIISNGYVYGILIGPGALKDPYLIRYQALNIVSKWLNLQQP